MRRSTRTGPAHIAGQSFVEFAQAALARVLSRFRGTEGRWQAKPHGGVVGLTPDGYPDVSRSHNPAAHRVASTKHDHNLGGRRFMTATATTRATDVPRRVDSLPWVQLRDELDRRGFAITPPLLTREECAELSDLFELGSFRSTIDMARHRFGQGRYRYFEHPLPEIIDSPQRRAWLRRCRSQRRR